MNSRMDGDIALKVAFFARRIAVLCSIVVLTVILMSLSGWNFNERASAASEGVDVTVDGSVVKDVQLDLSDCVGNALDIGELVPDDPPKFTSADCNVAFGSNNSEAGADLEMQEETSLQASIRNQPAMKCIESSCSGDTIPDLTASEMPDPGDGFALRIESMSSASSDLSLSPNVYAVGDSPLSVCRTSSSATGNCRFKFGAVVQSSGNSRPGSYRALVEFDVSAR